MPYKFDKFPTREYKLNKQKNRIKEMPYKFDKFSGRENKLY